MIENKKEIEALLKLKSKSVEANNLVIKLVDMLSPLVCDVEEQGCPNVRCWIQNNLDNAYDEISELRILVSKLESENLELRRKLNT